MPDQQAQHTPGPWGISTHDGAHFVGKKGFPSVARTWTDSPEELVNARLIAAAPETAAERDRLKSINDDLLAALETVLSSIEAFPSSGAKMKPNGGTANMIRAAIAKTKAGGA